LSFLLNLLISLDDCSILTLKCHHFIWKFDCQFFFCFPIDCFPRFGSVRSSSKFCLLSDYFLRLGY